MSMHLPDPVELVDSLTAAGSLAVIVSTGGGSLGIAHLLTTPGASEIVLEAIVPYARQAVDHLLGGPQQTYCSSRTARRLAMTAWQRACTLNAPPERAVGVAVTASLVSRIPKRGEHRIVVAVQTFKATSVASVVLQKNTRSRLEEEEIAAALFLEQFMEACCETSRQPIAGGRSVAHRLRANEPVERQREEAIPAWQDVLVGTRRAVKMERGTENAVGSLGNATTRRLLFPGSFDPLHEGHRLMARLAENIAEQMVEYELSIQNVDKPSLDCVELRARLTQFTDRALWLTHAPTFVEKVALFPDSTFVMGADTFVRLADKKYYGGSADAAARAVQQIAANARKLIVFGRVSDGVFKEPSQWPMPEALRDICSFVSQGEFRSDVSSTQLRQPDG